MKLLRCPKMHFYDGEKFPECPYCTGATGNRAGMAPAVSGSSATPAQTMPAEIAQQSDYEPTVMPAGEGEYNRTIILEGSSDPENKS